MATSTKWTTPGVGFSEIDNTVRPNAEPGDGIGAIVINANRGYPNQRVLCTTIDKFQNFSFHIHSIFHEQVVKPS
jgi:hypothetical protein